jgi:hypothetical protein
MSKRNGAFRSSVPDDKKQYNFTDPESRIMKANNKDWDQCGNAQCEVKNGPDGVFQRIRNREW